jgi:hypothetical protein
VTLQVGDARFAQFKRALRVRHRLMHPKDPADVVVRREEIDDALMAFLWFHEALNAVSDRWKVMLARDVAAARDREG